MKTGLHDPKRVFVEPSTEADKWAHEVIGAAIEVHKQLGPGFLESIYQAAMEKEFDLRNIPCAPQSSVIVKYKGVDVGENRMDFLVGGILVVELKAIDELHPVHTAQVVSYLKATGNSLGLLINFNVSVLKNGIKRVVRTRKL